jgi:hypothetical protein
MSDINRRQAIATIGGAAVVGLAGCAGGGDDGNGGDTDTDSPTEEGGMGTMTETDEEVMTPSGTARVRAAHMSPDAPNVDIYVDGSAALEDVPFRAVSDYLEVPAGPHQFTITEAGNQDNAVFDQEVPLEAEDYTLVAAGELTSEDTDFQVLPLVDDNSDPGGNQARLRAVHVSPDAGAVDVTVGAGAVLFDGVGFTDAGYVSVEANDYTAQIRPDTMENDGEVVYDADVSLNGGTVYTAFASGYLSPDDEPADEGFELTVVQDAST